MGSPVLMKFQPIPRSIIGDPPVVVGDAPRESVQVVEHVEDFSGMKRAGLLAWASLEPPFRGEGSAFEAKAGGEK